MTSSSYCFFQTGSVVVPAGATTMTGQAWGGGGSGAGGGTTLGCGGAGGGYSEFTTSVTPGSTVYFQVGAGGTNGNSTGAGNDGGTSWVNPSSNTQPSSGGCVASGGGGGQGSVGGTGGTGTIGTTNHSGGDGGVGGSPAGAFGGGGGGAGGPTSNGSNGSNATQGAGGTGTPPGGDGVHGTTGACGGAYNGGGGGGSWNSVGGDGGTGRVRLTFDAPQTLAIDATAGAQFTNASSGTITITTTLTDEVVVLMFYAENYLTAQPAVSSVTSANLTWAKRSAYSTVVNNVNETIEIWWAHATSALSAEVITVTLAGSTDNAAYQVISIPGCPTPNSPWDTNASLSSAQLGNSVLSGSIGTLTISTDATKNMAIGMWGNDHPQDATLPGSVFAPGPPVHNIGAGAHGYGYSQTFCQINTSKLTSASYAFTSAGFGNFVIAMDAINGDAVGSPGSSAGIGAATGKPKQTYWFNGMMVPV